jgi:hypothetical protein
MTALRIAPTDLRDYLKSTGWALIESALADRVYALQKDDLPRRQLVFPIDPSAPDYVDSVEGVLEKLSELTKQGRSSLISRIESVRDDVMRMRVVFDGNDSTLPLSFAASLVESAEKLLKAAACTVLRPRRHHPRLTLTEATQLVEKARFGQTEVGSFVLRVACPINALEVQGMLNLGIEEPFVRQVTGTLQRALMQLTTAIEADTLDALVSNLKSSPEPLVSSNLCEALSSMHDDQLDNSLDLAFEWSALRGHSGLHAHPIRLQREYFARIEEVRRELRSSDAHEAATYLGTVERLDGEMGEDGRRSGMVVLALLQPEEGETVRARMVLSADDYAKADHAHMTNGSYVVVTGRLLPGRQPRQLTDATSFEVYRPQSS